MAREFCPMLVSVAGETPETGFLPTGNYVLINGKKNPLGHCFTLEMPVGPCQVEVHTPPPNTIHRASVEVQEGQLFRVNLTVDGARNITDASFEVDEDGETADEVGLYEILCRQVAENRDKIVQWQAGQPSEPDAPVYTTGKKKGSKLFGWGIGLMLFFLCGIIGCFSGEIEMSNMTVYIFGILLGLGMFLIGLKKKNNGA